MDNEHEGMARWKKTGGGSFRMASGKIIKPNQVFWAREEDIPQGFRDVIIPLTEIPQDDVGPVSKEYTLKHRGAGWYDIEDGTGKVLNEKALRVKEAEAMLEALK